MPEQGLKSSFIGSTEWRADAALVVEMVERVRPPSRLPIQVVTPVPQQEEEEARVEEPVTPVQQVSPPRQESPNQTPPQENRDTERNSVIIVDSDSDSDFSD